MDLVSLIFFGFCKVSCLDFRHVTPAKKKKNTKDFKFKIARHDLKYKSTGL